MHKDDDTVKDEPGDGTEGAAPGDDEGDEGDDSEDDGDNSDDQ